LEDFTIAEMTQSLIEENENLSNDASEKITRSSTFTFLAEKEIVKESSKLTEEIVELCHLPSVSSGFPHPLLTILC
jgi:hypothetical protein